MMPLTMMPVGANGDSAPALAPLPTMIAIRKSGMPAREAVAMAIGVSSAAVAMLPGPIDDSAAPSTKNMIGIVPAFPRQMRTAWCVELRQRAVRLRHREQQRHAGERQKQLARKARHHGAHRQATHVHADDPRHGDGEHADVQAAEAADQHRQGERAHRDRRPGSWVAP